MTTTASSSNQLLALLIQAQAQQQRAREEENRRSFQDGLLRLLQAAPAASTSASPPRFAFTAPSAMPKTAEVAQASAGDVLMDLLLKNRAEIQRGFSPSPTASLAPSAVSADSGITTDRIQQVVKLLQSEELRTATPPPPTLSPEALELCQRIGVAIPAQFVAASTVSASSSTSVAASSEDEDEAPRKGRAIEFPKTLHMMLKSLEAAGQGHIASYTPDGSGFVIRKPKEFAAQALARYCTSSNYASFQRQVNLYCFQRTKRGVENIYRHPMFHRDQPELCLGMVRTKIKNEKLRNKKNASV